MQQKDANIYGLNENNKKLGETNDKIIIEYNQKLLDFETKFELLNKTQKEVAFI